MSLPNAVFQQKGWLYLPRALSASLVQPVQRHVLEELKRLKIWANGRPLSSTLKDVPLFQQTGKLSQQIQYPELDKKLVTAELHSLLKKLTSAPFSGIANQLLISLPHKLEWTLEGLNWHRDISGTRLQTLPGIQLFFLLDDVKPKGGGTLVLSGSHLLRDQSLAKQALTELGSNGRTSLTKAGVDLSIVEMSGKAGDVYLMDMRLLHTPSINASTSLRLMATTRYYMN